MAPGRVRRFEAPQRSRPHAFLLRSKANSAAKRLECRNAPLFNDRAFRRRWFSPPQTFSILSRRLNLHELLFRGAAIREPLSAIQRDRLFVVGAR